MREVVQVLGGLPEKAVVHLAMLESIDEPLREYVEDGPLETIARAHGGEKCRLIGSTKNAKHNKQVLLNMVRPVWQRVTP